MAFAFVSSLFLIAAVIMLSNGTANQREIRPIEEQEYDILLRKILGQFDTPVSSISKKKQFIIQKYYRWVRNGRDIRVGSSGKTIYIDGKNC